MTEKKPAVVEAQKEIGAVLEELEQTTDSVVQKIGLDDVVDTDPRTGKPVVQKAVDITLNPRPARSWSK